MGRLAQMTFRGVKLDAVGPVEVVEIAQAVQATPVVPVTPLSSEAKQ